MYRLALIGLLPILVAASGSAQNPPIFTEAEYLSVLDEAHPAVRDSAEVVARAEARVLETTTLENPVLGAVREEPSGSIRQTEILISWRLPDLARRDKIEAREQELAAARERFEQQLLANRLAMREVYATWAVADDRQRRLAAQAARVESLAERETTRSENGETSGLEAHRLRLAATALRSRVALAAAASERMRAEVVTWYPDLPIDARPVLPDLPAAPSLDGSNPQVRVAEADLEAARLARIAVGRYLTSPEVSLGWQRQETGSEAIGGPIVGLAWSVPLFDRKQAARDAADASIAGARARLEVIEREVNASRTAARKSFASLSAAFARARQELAVNERMLDGAEAAFRHGEAGLTDLLETHRSVTEADLALLDLHEAALAAHRELERLAGSATPQPAAPQPAAPQPATRTPHTDNEPGHDQEEETHDDHAP